MESKFLQVCLKTIQLCLFLTCQSSLKAKNAKWKWFKLSNQTNFHFAFFSFSSQSAGWHVLKFSNYQNTIVRGK